MSNQRTHHVTTSDNVSVGGTVHGQGPALVFLPGMMGDGDCDWQALLPHLTDRFTCHLPSWRGRGLSGDHPDLSPGRAVDDVIAYADSIGQPTGLVGWSFGANIALVAAAQSDAIPSVAAVGPVTLGRLDEQLQAQMGEAVVRTSELVAQGNLTAAARTIAGLPFSDAEIAMAEDAGYFEAVARYVPNCLSLLQQAAQYEGPTVDDPAVLDAISVPVLVLHVASTPFHTTSVRYVADHVPNARVREIPGAGHAAPLTHPEPLAEAIGEFFAPAQQPA